MSPYLLTVLSDEAALVVFSALASVVGVRMLAAGRALLGTVLLGAAGVVVAGIGPVVASLAAGRWLSASLPGVSLAEIAPWAALAVLAFARRAPGPRDYRVDATSLVGLALAMQGLAGFVLGLGLLAQQWLSPGRDRRLIVAAVGVLSLALLVDRDPIAVRASLGGSLGLSLDAQVWVAHLAVSSLEAAGWAGVLWSVLAGTPGIRADEWSRGASRPRPRW